MVCHEISEARNNCFVELFYLAAGLGVIGACRQVFDEQVRGHGCKEF